MDKKVCFDCGRNISSGREVRFKENGPGWGVGGGRYGRGGWGGGGGWGTSGDAAFFWICASCYRKRKRRRLIIILLIVGFFLLIFLGVVAYTLIKAKKYF